MKIVVANANYSSWSLRAWLAVKATGLPFEEVMIDLDGPETVARIAEHTPAGKVPVLIDGAVTVWDSLAIVEYLAEIAPDAGLWPTDRAARAHARSIVAEMHSGFSALRNHFPMNIRRPPAAREATAGAAADIARIAAIWREARATYGAAGPFLFGRFSAADAFYAPVASRFRTYAIGMGPVESAYIDAIFAHPAMAEWVARGRAETWVIAADEVD